MNIGYRTFDIQCSIFEIHYKYPIVVIPACLAEWALRNGRQAWSSSSRRTIRDLYGYQGDSCWRTVKRYWQM